MKYLIFSCLIAFQTGYSLDNGTKAPDFELTGHDGKTHKLSESKGKWVVLEWYNKDCPFVRKHYDSKNMQKLQKDYKEKGVVWYSIISSKPGKQGYLTTTEAKEQIKTEESFAQYLLLDSEGKVGKSYGAKTTPHMFIINPEGSVVYQGAIDDIASSDQADIKSAKNYVKSTLDLALNGKKVEPMQTSAYGCSVKY